MSFDISLLFKEALVKEGEDWNQLIERTELRLSKEQIQELTLKRAEVLQNNHLLDLSFHTQEYLLKQLSQSTLVTPKNYFQYVVDAQELFYYLRSNSSYQIADEELLAILIEKFDAYDGSLSHLQGYFEEWLIAENLKRSETDDLFSTNS